MNRREYSAGAVKFSFWFMEFHGEGTIELYNLERRYSEYNLSI